MDVFNVVYHLSNCLNCRISKLKIKITLSNSKKGKFPASSFKRSPSWGACDAVLALPIKLWQESGGAAAVEFRVANPTRNFCSG